MNTPRINMYAGIHEALRNFISEIQHRLSRTDAADNEELQGALSQVRGYWTERASICSTSAILPNLR